MLRLNSLRKLDIFEDSIGVAFDVSCKPSLLGSSAGIIDLIREYRRLGIS